MPYKDKLYPLNLQLTGSENNLFPQAKIFYSGIRYIDQNPKNLDNVAMASGMYTSLFIPSMNGYYAIQYKVYISNKYSSLSSDYGNSQELIFVEDYVDDINSISSIVAWISSNLEAYGGGGAKSYNVYSKVLSPWNKDTVKKVIKDVEDTKDKVDKLSKEEAKYHKDDEKRLEKLIKILDNILLTSVEKKDMKGIKESIDIAKKKLEEYKKDKSLDIDKLNKDLVAIVKMLSLRMTDEELDKILESDIEEIK